MMNGILEDLEDIAMDENVEEYIEDTGSVEGVYTGMVRDKGVIYVQHDPEDEEPFMTVIGQYDGEELRPPTSMNSKDIINCLTGTGRVELTNQFIEKCRKQDINNSKDYINY